MSTTTPIVVFDHPAMSRSAAAARRSAYCTAALALTAFVIALANASAFAGFGVTTEWNVLFDADPNVYLRNFSTGRTIGTWGGRSFIHPNLTTLIHPPIRVLGALLARLPFDLGPAAGIREAMALLVSPLFAAVRVVVVMRLMRALGLPLAASVVMCAIDMLSFSTLLFASIPESYIVTGTLLAVMFGLAARETRGDHPPGGTTWLLATAAFTAVAMLNLPVAAVLMALALAFRHPRRRALGAMAFVASGALVLNAIVFKLTQRVFAPQLGFDPLASQQLPDAWNPGMLRALVDYPRAIANAFLCGSPARVPIMEPQNLHPFVFSLERANAQLPMWDVRTFVVLGCLAAGIACLRVVPRALRPLHVAAIAVMAQGAVVHAFFGRELFLYSQHWHIAALVLMSGLWHLPGRARAIVAVVMPCLALWIAVNNAFVMRGLMAALR